MTLGAGEGEHNVPESYTRIRPTHKKTSPGKQGQLEAKTVREEATGSRTAQKIETYQDKLSVHKVQVQK